MAKKVVTIYTDDLTGEQSDEVTTHAFAVDGVQYEIDLSPDSHDQLLEVLGPFMQKGRKLGRGRAGKQRRTPSQDTAKIREWAKANGYEVSERGRVPASVREAYEKAH